MRASKEQLPAPSGRYHTLDGMRGVAALLVAAFHFGQLGRQFVPGGYLAVDLFFALSGFVIAANYAGKIAAGMGWRAFARARFIRLYPIYAIGALLGMAHQMGLMLLRAPHRLRLLDVALAGGFSLCMVPLPRPLAVMMGGGAGGGAVALFPHNGPAWSLFFELCVNGLFVGWLVRCRGRWLAAICAVAGAYMVMRVGAPDYMNLGWAWENIDMGAARALFGFTLGLGLQRMVPARQRPDSMLAAAAIGAVALLLVLPVAAAARGGFELVVVGLIFPALLLVGIGFDPPRWMRGPFAALGDISYAVYAIHWPLRAGFAMLAGRLHLGAPGGTALFLGGVALMAFGITHGLDRPLRQWLGRRLAPRREPMGAVAGLRAS